MATKKGIIITATILAVITVASFVVWFLPQNRGGSSILISDYKSELDSIKERHSLIITEIESSLKGLSNKTISPDDFTNQAQASSSQVTTLTSEMIEINPPVEWKQSYGNYFESLKNYNDYLIETISLAGKMKTGISVADLDNEMLKLDSLKNEYESFAAKSDKTRP